MIDWILGGAALLAVAATLKCLVSEGLNIQALMFALVGTLILTCLVEGLAGCIRNRKVKTRESNDE